MIACHVIWYPGFVHWQFVFNIGSCYGVSLSLWRHSNSLKFRKNGILRLNQFYLKTALMILMKLGMDFRWGRANFWWRHSLRENSHCDVIMVWKSAKFYPEVGESRVIPHMKALCRLISDLFCFAIMTSSRDVTDVNVLKIAIFEVLTTYLKQWLPAM